MGCHARRSGSGGTAELEGFDCLLIAPASPYRSRRALSAPSGLPARLISRCSAPAEGSSTWSSSSPATSSGYDDAEHAELIPDATGCSSRPCHARSSARPCLCTWSPASFAADGVRPRHEVPERYYCDFGLNPEYLAELVAAASR